jgi:thiosulfate/3-mercaptopyruvate sulfurtransferase
MVDKLVTADWVQEHLNDDNVRLVEVDVDTEAYREGHIEGAVAWNWTTQLQDPVTRDILTKADFEQLMSQAGITPDTHVVLYGDNNNWFAAYALWLMELYGHKNVSLMDGGRVKWLGDNRPTHHRRAGCRFDLVHRAGPGPEHPREAGRCPCGRR